MIHKQQGEALADVLAMIRPGDWKPPQTVRVLAANRETPHPFPVIAEVAIRAARNPAIKSPDGIFLPGKHWDIAEHQAHTPPPTPCGDHPEEPAHNCRCCWADVRAGDRAPDQIGKPTSPKHRTEPPAGWRNRTEATPNRVASSVETADE